MDNIIKGVESHRTYKNPSAIVVAASVVAKELVTMEIEKSILDQQGQPTEETVIESVTFCPTGIRRTGKTWFHIEGNKEDGCFVEIGTIK